MTMFIIPSFVVKVAMAIVVMFGAYHHGPSLVIHMAPPGLGFFVQPRESDEIIPEAVSDVIDSSLGNMMDLWVNIPFLDHLTSSLPKDIQWSSLNKVGQMVEKAFPISSYFKREHKSPEKKELLKIEPKSHVKEESEKNNMNLSVVDIDIYDSIAHNNDPILTRDPLIETSLAISEQFSDTEQENQSKEQTDVSREIVPSNIMVEQTDGIKSDQELTTDNNDDDDDYDDDDDQFRKTGMKPQIEKDVDDDDDDDDVITKIVDVPNLLPSSPSDYESIGTFDSMIKKRKPLKDKYKLMLTVDEAKYLDESFLINLQHQYEGQCSFTYSENKRYIYFEGQKPVAHKLSNEIRCSIYNCIQEEPVNIIRRFLEDEEEKKTGEEDDDRPVKSLVRYHLRGKDEIVFGFSVSEMARRIIIGKWGWNYKRIKKEHSVTMDVNNDSQIVLLKGQKDDVQLAYDSLKKQVKNSGLV